MSDIDIQPRRRGLRDRGGWRRSSRGKRRADLRCRRRIVPTLLARSRRIAAYPRAGEVVPGTAEIRLKLAERRADRRLYLRLRRGEPRGDVSAVDRDAHREVAKLWRVQPHGHLARAVRQHTG